MLLKTTCLSFSSYKVLQIIIKHIGRVSKRHFASVKGTVLRDFRLQIFFLNQFPKPLSIPLEPFQIFLKIFRDIFTAQGAPPVSLTPVPNGKNLQSEKF
jgi:hypothetical protein